MARMEEFQRNFAFVAFMIIVCFGVFVYLTRNLRETIAPLCWAAFFAVPSTLLISYIDRSINQVMSCLKRLWSCIWQSGSPRLVEVDTEEPESVGFVANGWQITLNSPDGNSVYRNEQFLRKVNAPCSRHCSKILRFLRLESCFRRRVRISELEHEDHAGDTGANGLVKGWAYYACQKEDGEGEALETLELYLDASEQYPAVFSRSTTGPRLRGKLEIDKSSSLSWLVSLLLTLAIMAAGVWFFVAFIQMGVNSFKDNLSDYSKGVMEFLDLIKPIFPKQVWQDIQKKATEFLNNELPDLASQVVSNLESLSFQALMFFVYLFFWIFEPLPISSPVAEVFKSYLLLKTFVCLLFAMLMSALLVALQCKIWSLFFVLTFLLNFIPEIGAIASAILTVPAILFDGHLPQQQRLENLLWLVIVGTCIKVFTGNVVEVQMYASLGGQFMRMHPVIIMALIMLFSALLGVTGMFLAVPTMAAVKYYLVSTDMPKQFKHPLLVFIEGDETAPHKNYVEQQRLIEHHFLEPAGAVELGRSSWFAGGWPHRHRSAPWRRWVKKGKLWVAFEGKTWYIVQLLQWCFLNCLKWMLLLLSSCACKVRVRFGNVSMIKPKIDDQTVFWTMNLRGNSFQ